jgi:hypothetical protein
MEGENYVIQQLDWAVETASIQTKPATQVEEWRVKITLLSPRRRTLFV